VVQCAAHAPPPPNGGRLLRPSDFFDQDDALDFALLKRLRLAAVPDHTDVEAAIALTGLLEEEFMLRGTSGEVHLTDAGSREGMRTLLAVVKRLKVGYWVSLTGRNLDGSGRSGARFGHAGAVKKSQARSEHPRASHCRRGDRGCSQIPCPGERPGCGRPGAQGRTEGRSGASGQPVARTAIGDRQEGGGGALVWARHYLVGQVLTSTCAGK
jgi:hypothetical protein